MSSDRYQKSVNALALVAKESGTVAVYMRALRMVQYWGKARAAIVEVEL
jgi:hypothetical protein